MDHLTDQSTAWILSAYSLVFKFLVCSYIYIYIKRESTKITHMYMHYKSQHKAAVTFEAYFTFCIKPCKVFHCCGELQK